jgi:hypothetical protein
MNARTLHPGLLGLSLITLTALAQAPETGGTSSVAEDARLAVADLPAGRVALSFPSNDSHRIYAAIRRYS